LDESRVELTNILQQLVANGDLTTTASNNIVNKLNKLDSSVLTKILNAACKKPEAIALINTLSKYPKVVYAIKSGDITGLNSSELKIFDSLNVLDDKTSKVLVEYYSNNEADLFKWNSMTPQLVTFAQQAKSDCELAERIASYNIDDLKAEEQLINNCITGGEAVYTEIIDVASKFKLRAYLLDKIMI